MIRKAAERPVEVRANLRGGTGEVTIRHYFKPDEFGAKTRLCALLTLPPGASIGTHAHAGEDEIYLIVRGSGLLEEDGRETRVQAGDAVLTGKGSTHAIRNGGTEPLEIAATILLYT
jgi:mannose-6-phosphate isomerase-like protein (cupin superfamily)